MNINSDWKVENIDRQIRRTQKGLRIALNTNKPQWVLQTLHSELVRLKYEKATLFSVLMKDKVY